MYMSRCIPAYLLWILPVNNTFYYIKIWLPGNMLVSSMYKIQEQLRFGHLKQFRVTIICMLYLIEGIGFILQL